MRGSFGSTPMGLPTLKRLTEVVVEGGGQLSVVLLGHPKLKNDLRRQPLPSQVMCAGNGHLSRVEPFIIARRYR